MTQAESAHENLKSQIFSALSEIKLKVIEAGQMGKINWGHVGDLGRILENLQDITKYLNS